MSGPEPHEPHESETATDSREQRMQALQKQLLSAGVARLASVTSGSAIEGLSTGCPALDDWFPQGGLVRGQTVELIASGRGSGATALAMILARAVCGDDGLLVIIDRQQTFYPALLLSLGVDLENVLFVHPQSEEDHLWALEQALADRAVAAVWTAIDKLDKRYQRRWQLAAERGQTVGLLQRPAKVLGHPTWATLQLEVRPNPHSHWLVSHPRAANAVPSSAENWPGSAENWPGTAENWPGSAENWIVQVVAQRGVGRFERPPLQLEIHNHHDPLEPGVPSVFLRQRLPRPSDPWFTKPAASDSAAAAGTPTTALPTHAPPGQRFAAPPEQRSAARRGS